MGESIGEYESVWESERNVKQRESEVRGEQRVGKMSDTGWRGETATHSPQSTVHSPQSTVHSPQSTSHSPQSTVHSSQFTALSTHL